MRVQQLEKPLSKLGQNKANVWPRSGGRKFSQKKKRVVCVCVCVCVCVRVWVYVMYVCMAMAYQQISPSMITGLPPHFRSAQDLHTGLIFCY